jgi:hypothetical protein
MLGSVHGWLDPSTCTVSGEFTNYVPYLLINIAAKSVDV